MNRQFILAVSVLVCIGMSVLVSKAFAAESVQPRKAAFLDEKELAFIRPGLVFTIEQAWVEGDGTVKYRFTVADLKGAPLDLDGVFTPGEISIRSTVAFIPQGDSLYRSYITRLQTSPETGDSANQASFDVGGSFQKLADGTYLYTYGFKLPVGYEVGSTHTVAAWARRDLSEFELGTDRDAATFDWVPSGAEVTVVRNVVSDQSCNQCHGELSAHDDRTEVALCVVCHTPQSKDPDTGNTVDMTTMVHKIHMGEELASVQAGEPYQIIGFLQSVHDYSSVVYPADVRNCQTCHIENIAAVASATPREARLRRQDGRGGRISTMSVAGRTRLTRATSEARNLTIDSNHHLLRPSRRACGSCHESVNFATGEHHAGLPQISDTQCSRCHTPQGELEFDLSIKGSHTIARFSKELPGVNFELFGVTNAGPGLAPVVEFGITNDAGQPVVPSQMSRLALVLAGDNEALADFTQFISENATAAASQGGRFVYTFQQPIPVDATGSWAVGIEGYQNATILPGTLQERSARDAGENKTLYFSVTGGAPTPRRRVVAQAKCDSCHYSLDLHGSNRNAVDQCVLCHNPATTDVARRPADQGPPESVNFKEMIHRIHSGEELSRDLTIYGFGGTPHIYNEVRYPRERTACFACHVDDSELLPLTGDLASTVDPRGLFDPAPPNTGACLSCHDNLATAAHADLTISPIYGESCDVCHGEGSAFAVEKSHAR